MPDETPDTVIVLACRNVSNDNGCDDERASTFELSYLVFDQTHEKIVSSVEKIIEPLIPEKEDDVQSCLSDETELSDSEVLRSFLQQLELHFEKEPVDVFTFGPLALRHFLHCQAARKKIKLHEGLYSYFDVGLEFKRTFPEHEDDAEDIERVASHLNINLPSSKPQGLELCKIILQIMQQLPSNDSRQIIQPQYSHVQSYDSSNYGASMSQSSQRLLPSTEDEFTGWVKTNSWKTNGENFNINSSPLLEDTIVRVRGFSPSTTEVKLARFFAGLNIESGGILMCMNSNGRPSCDALVRFTNKEQRDLALKRNGTKFGSRNLEVCKANVQEFSRIMNQDPSQEMPQTLNNFLHLAAPAAVIIRMRGLPYNTKASEIVTFFGDDFPVFRGENGIFFVYHPDGRPTGDAFVLFEKVEHGKQALTKHRQSIGKRYVELFQTSRNEVVQIFSRFSAFVASGVPPAAFPVPRPLRPAITEAVMQNKGYLSNNKDIIRLRGLPYAASVQDILDFLNEFGKYVVPAGVHMVYNLQGRPSGDAFIEMRSAEHAQKASESLHKKHIGERYIEVFQCSSADMAFMLMHGIPNYRHQQHNTWVNRPYSPRTPPLVPSTFTYPPVSSSALSYPPVSSPPSVSHTSNTAHGPIISIPPSPTLSPTARVFMTSPSPGYVTYPTSPYNVFNFTYPPPPGVAVEAPNMGHTQPMMSPTPYDAPMFIPRYQVNKDFTAVAQMDPSYFAVNHYVPPTNCYYTSNETYTEPGHIPAYVETYSG